MGVAFLSPAENGGRGEPIPGLAHLNTVAVNPERWGMGIGRALVALIVEHARQVGSTSFSSTWTRTTSERTPVVRTRRLDPAGEAVPFEDAVLLAMSASRRSGYPNITRARHILPIGVKCREWNYQCAVG